MPRHSVAIIKIALKKCDRIYCVQDHRETITDYSRTAANISEFIRVEQKMDDVR